jgi:hypothetical protein|eukprot:COSAG01_NODE_1146_length_11522_cov_103.027916_2_plen_44_part_00
MQKVLESVRNSETWASVHRRTNKHITEYHLRDISVSVSEIWIG